MDTRDEVVDFVHYWYGKTDLRLLDFLIWLGLAKSKFYRWRDRYGKVNEHNGLVPRDYWLEPWEKQSIIDYYHEHPGEGYRRLTYMMMDEDITAVSPSSTYRVLSAAGLLTRWSKASKKGTGFIQPLRVHEHWHIDISYINICGTFYYLCSIIDGYSRYLVHWTLAAQMKEADVELVLQQAREKFPDSSPRVISDNGPQFIAKDFKEFIRVTGMSHVRTSPYYPQSNGKIERWHQTMKDAVIRKKVPLSLQEAIDQLGIFVDHYNNERLHSAIGYITPSDKLAGREAVIHEARENKLAAARDARKAKRLIKVEQELAQAVG